MKKPRNRHERKLGRYRLGIQNVDVFLRYDLDAANIQLWPATGCGRLNIGMGYERWHEVFENLLHEAMELALIQMGLRFAPAPDFAVSSSGYVFILNHEQFQEAMARCADFLATATPDLHKAFNAKRRGRKK